MKKAALIHDLSGFGRCSLTAAIPVISALGIQAVPLPTAVLSAQTGFGDYALTDLTEEMGLFTSKWKRMNAHFDAIYSGYLSDTAQLQQVSAFLDAFHSPDTLFLADPILGDLGRRFPMFQDDFVAMMRELTRSADVITPNLTEACLLADKSYDDITSAPSKPELLARVKDLAYELRGKAHRPQTVVITGILCQESTIGNLTAGDFGDTYVESVYTGQSYSGTGDLFTSVLCGCLLRGSSVPDAIRKAVAFLEASIADAAAQHIPRDEGVPFENHLNLLIV